MSPAAEPLAHPEVTNYVWRGFMLTLDRVAGRVFTTYADGTWSGGGTVPEDTEHALALGITPLAHRLSHEMGHHVVAIARGITTSTTGCRIIWRNAHREPQREPEAAQDEWRITAFQYYAHDRAMRNTVDWDALKDLQGAGINLPRLADRFRWLLAAADYASAVTMPSGEATAA